LKTKKKANRLLSLQKWNGGLSLQEGPAPEGTCFQARLAFTLAAFNLLVQWHGLKPNEHGFVPLLLAEFSL
jgi:hypothetical protein